MEQGIAIGIGIGAGIVGFLLTIIKTLEWGCMVTDGVKDCKREIKWLDDFKTTSCESFHTLNDRVHKLEKGN